jgi:hypothetical protein
MVVPTDKGGRKRFFFGKKEAKTFYNFGSWAFTPAEPVTRQSKVLCYFLVTESRSCTCLKTLVSPWQ